MDKHGSAFIKVFLSLCVCMFVCEVPKRRKVLIEQRN